MKPRSVERVRSLLGGQIIFNHQNSTLDCQIRNISPAGAKLVLSSMVALPEEFELNIPQKGRTFRARLRWRIDDAAGVEFMDAEKVDASAGQLANRIRDLETENEALRQKLRELIGQLGAQESEAPVG